MDLDKINMDLVESLLEWIVEGKHNYPPGKKTTLTAKQSQVVEQVTCQLEGWRSCSSLHAEYPWARLTLCCSPMNACVNVRYA